MEEQVLVADTVQAVQAAAAPPMHAHPHAAATGTFVTLARWLLDVCGVEHASDTVATLIMVVLSTVISVSLFWVAKFIIFKVVKRIIAKTPTDWDDYVFSDRVLLRASYLPSIFSMMAFGLAMHTDNWINAIYMKVVYVYMTVSIGRFLLAILDSVFDLVADKYPKARSLMSIKQLFTYVVFVLMVIVLIAVIIGKSPATLLTGLGASAAIMSLVFKETIQSLVSGIQLSANNMVAVGDWIVVPKAQANGIVSEMTLNTVKIRNWDNTITTVSPSTLLSDSFTNWKGMSESYGRRINRSICIDMDTVRFLSEEEERRFRNMPELFYYFQLRDAGNDVANDRLTNLTLFREYMAAYLSQSPLVYNPEDATRIQLMVRYLQPTQYGLPVEIYCFSKTQVWSEYENVIAVITDHMIAASEMFGLQPYQVSSSSSNGGKPLDDIDPSKEILEQRKKSLDRKALMPKAD